MALAADRLTSGAANDADARLALRAGQGHRLASREAISKGQAWGQAVRRRRWPIPDASPVVSIAPIAGPLGPPAPGACCRLATDRSSYRTSPARSCWRQLPRHTRCMGPGRLWHRGALVDVAHTGRQGFGFEKLDTPQSGIGGCKISDLRVPRAAGRFRIAGKHHTTCCSSRPRVVRTAAP